MSASMYNNPYIYKRPLPKIEYPPLFQGLSNISFKHVLDSKFLALSAVLFIVAAFIEIVVLVLPFWFKLVLSPEDGTFGSMAVKRKLSINSGIVFMNEDQFDNLITLDKNSNHDVVPKMLVLAQVLAIMGMCSLVACLAASLILSFRRFTSVTANFFLAFFATVTGVFLLIVFLLVLLMSTFSSCDPYETGSACQYKDNLVWRQLPLYTQQYRIVSEITPLIKLNWAAYIAIIPALLTLAGSVLLWIEAIGSYKSMVAIRYEQLRNPRDPYENDDHPADQGKYKFQAPEQHPQHGYGMQPVMVQGNPYNEPRQPHHPPSYNQTVGFNQQPSAPSVGFQQPRGVGFSDSSDYEGGSSKRRDSSPPPRRRSPPPMRRRDDSSPDEYDDSPPPARRRHSPPPPRRGGNGGGGRGRSPSPPRSRRRSPSPPPRDRRGPPSVNSSVSEGPYISREIDL